MIPLREIDRREVVAGGFVVTGAASLAACSLFTSSGGTDAANWVTNLLTTLGNIQSEVKARFAQACGIANAAVPSITMALEALKAALGATTIGPTTTILATAVEAAVSGIVAIGCGSTAPTAAPGAPLPQATINGKTIPIQWV